MSTVERTNMLRRLFLVLLLSGMVLAWKSASYAQGSLPQIVLYGLSEPVTVTSEAGRDGANEPGMAARVCVKTPEGPKHCFEAKAEGDCFPLNPETVPVSFPNASNTSAILFASQENFGGSGTGTFISLLVWNNGLENVFPATVLSSQSDYQLWTDAAVSDFPLLTVADFTLSKGESHFGNHHYKVKTFVFDQQKQKYFLRDEYITKAKYAVIDTTKRAQIVKAELPSIKARLDRKSRK